MKNDSIRMRSYRESIYQHITPIDEDRHELIPEHCTAFGCGKILTLVEKLCGDRCINHPKQSLTFYNPKL